MIFEAFLFFSSWLAWHLVNMEIADMESLISFFEDIPTTYRSGILIGGIFIFWVMEGLVPLFQFQYNKYRHANPVFA
ncbi:MAG: hypothetical protein WD381_00425 [Balneolaceae bacterium]